MKTVEVTREDREAALAFLHDDGEYTAESPAAVWIETGAYENPLNDEGEEPEDEDMVVFDREDELAERFATHRARYSSLLDAVHNEMQRWYHIGENLEAIEALETAFARARKELSNAPA